LSLRGEKLSEYSQRAKELFKQGYNCSQAVFAAFCNDIDIDFETALKMEFATTAYMLKTYIKIDNQHSPIFFKYF
jgi:hypothetical protein